MRHFLERFFIPVHLICQEEPASNTRMTTMITMVSTMKFAVLLLGLLHSVNAWSLPFWSASSASTKFSVPRAALQASPSLAIGMEPVSGPVDEAIRSGPHDVSLSSPAIVLNTNARSVSEDMIALVRETFDSEHVFVTCTQEEARQAARQIVAAKHPLVIPVGGDGTLSSMVNYLCDELMERSDDDSGLRLSVEEAMGRLPVMGYIPLGTGNGVGSVIGNQVKRGFPLFGTRKRKLRAFQALLQQFQRASQHIVSQTPDDSFSILKMPMMEVRPHTKDTAVTSEQLETTTTTTKGDLCFFAGIGFDSLMLNDFKSVKAWSRRTKVMTRALSSITGYCVALLVKTLPQCVLHGRHVLHIRLTTPSPENTLWVDHRRGDFSQPVCTENDAFSSHETVPTVESDDGSTLLFEGTTGILAAGTSPFYGGGLRLFPFARMIPDKMHLRLGRISPLVGLLHIPSIFGGSYRDKSPDQFGCLDFLGTDFQVELNQPTDCYPFQHSGESVGNVSRFRLSLIKEPVKFVSFLPRRRISIPLSEK